MAKKVTVAEYITSQIKVCGKSQKQIADESGFQTPNILSMIRHGNTKLPIPRVNALADALEVPRAKLMKMVLKEYQPEILEAIESSLGPIVIKPEK
jgi:transcriptional regulator with XRE-family HTH domain